MLRQRLFTIFSTTLLVGLFLATGVGYSPMATSTMPEMGKQMSQSQCQSSCTQQTGTIVNNLKTVLSEKDIEPQPAEPYYLAFLGVGWSLIISLGFYLPINIWRKYV